VMEKGVAAMQKPSLAGLDGDPQWPRECPGKGIRSTSSRAPGSARTLANPNHASPPGSTGSQCATA
jgi:hypothetical protein